ncbi:MAG: cadherin-like beta sandwich domain-containing protein, partial [Gammaproteobacteria bacterium]
MQGGLAYQVRIRGSDEEFDHGNWSVVSEISIPAAPTGLSASRSGNTISVGWTAQSGATGYKIRWARSAQDWINQNAGGGETPSGATSHEITGLESGRNYNIQVAAVTAAGPGAWSASINQSGRVLSVDAALSGLVITDENGADLGIAFDPAFAPGAAAAEPYTLAVANAIAAVKVRASATDPFSITISAVNVHARDVPTLAPSVVANRALSPSIPLTAGRFQYAVIQIVVVAEDGATTLIYEVQVTRLSNDATLAQLFALNRIEVGTLTPAFAPGDPAKLDYRVEVPNDTASVEVAAVVTGVDDVVIDDIRFVSGGMQHLPNTFTQLGDPGSAVSPALPLTAGVARVVMIIIPAHDLTTLTYTLTIVRLGSGSADSSLSDLQIAHSGGAVALRKIGGSGGFASAHLAYAASVESSTGSVTITPIDSHPNAAITIGKRGEIAAAATSGSAHTQALAFGENTLDIIVTAENVAQRIYTLTLTRTPQSTDATLQSLSLSAGMLSPQFSPGDDSYTARVANGTATITLTPAVNDARASVRVGGASVVSGQASAPQTLIVGANDIEIVVTAEDESSMTYVVSVTRLPAVASANANLSALTTSAGALSPNFIADTFAYAVSARNADANITITPTVEDTGKASVTVDGAAVTSGQASGAIDLDVNVAKEILVVVTAEDGVAMKTYTLRVTRAQSSDNTLSGLTLSDDAELDSAFAADTLAYSVMVAHAVTAITLTPVVNQPDAR